MPEFWSNPKSRVSPKIKKLTASANGVPCMCCGIQDGTVVSAHRNEGKGTSLKTPDWQIAYLCNKCHFELDNGKDLTKEERRNMWNAAYVKTVDYWFRNRIVVIS